MGGAHAPVLLGVIAETCLLSAEHLCRRQTRKKNRRSRGRRAGYQGSGEAENFLSSLLSAFLQR